MPLPLDCVLRKVGDGEEPKERLLVGGRRVAVKMINCFQMGLLDGEVVAFMRKIICGLATQ